jgi:hypothetical protein
MTTHVLSYSISSARSPSLLPVYTHNGPWILGVTETSCTYFFSFLLLLSYCIKRPDNARYWRKGALLNCLDTRYSILVLLARRWMRGYHDMHLAEYQ